ncbi:MAG: hypothetical protein VYD90_10535 [Pseudomonadota bacterium]|nr:hypothetical protein [Pseudomonadota bacterium]
MAAPERRPYGGQNLPMVNRPARKSTFARCRAVVREARQPHELFDEEGNSKGMSKGEPGLFVGVLVLGLAMLALAGFAGLMPHGGVLAAFYQWGAM